MSRFKKISLIVVFCGVALFMAPLAAHASGPDINLIDVNGTTVTKLSFRGQNGTVSVQNVAIGGFTVSLLGQVHLVPDGVLELTAAITGGGPRETLTILLTNTDYPRTGLSTFLENVTGTITGPGTVTFEGFLDQNDQPFSTTHGTSHLPLLGPYGDPDAPISGSDTTTVTDTMMYSMTSQTMVTGGDVSFTFTLRNTPNP
jgi:hypothetical protein